MVKNEPPVGSHIKVKRELYTHHGVYVGRGWVAELAKPSEGGRARVISMARFAQGRQVERVYQSNQLPLNQIRQNLHRHWATARYDLLKMNCEQFATLCTTNHKQSAQVEGWTRVVVGGALAALAVSLAR